MKYSLNLIKKYVPEVASVPVKDLIARIWSSVAEVEEVEYLEEKYQGIVVSKITEIVDHPKSEKLIVATVDIGQKEPVTVVTAAHNISVGDFVPYIPVGGKVPEMKDEQGNLVEIGVRSMAGIPSIGMLASEKELGLSTDHSGIMILKQEELRQELVVGEPISVALELNDVVFEIENKSLTHRGDCFSAAGIAREIATLYGFELVIPEWQTPSFSIPNLVGDAFEQTLSSDLQVKVSAVAAVERYSALVLDGVEVKQSPLWLRLFLNKHGVNLVNNIVDITNYVMLEYGQPMHAFDAATVTHKSHDNKIVYDIDVRYAKAGETLVTLDSKEKKLPPIATVIADSEKVLAIAGIIGGLDSGINDTSTRIILESAVFNKYAIRNASMSIGTTTDASVVFSRKQDPEKTVRALLRAVHLLTELAGARVASEISDSYPPIKLTSTLVVSHERIEKFLGIAVSPNEVVRILEGLGCVVVKKNGMFRIESPTWRPDLAIDEDIYEEIARHVGYKQIVPELPKRGIFGVALSTYENGKQATLKALTALGMNQAMNFSFVSKQLYDRAQLSITEARSVVNAISPEVQYIRKHLIPGLLEQLSKNQHNAEKFGLFELGKISRKGLSYTGAPVSELHMPDSQFGVDDLGLPIEDEHVSIGVVDNTEQPGFFTLKRIVNKYLAAMHINGVFTHPSDLVAKELKLLPTWTTELFSFFKKGRVAIVTDGKSGEFLGIIGEPGTLVLKEFGFTKQVAIAEFSLKKIVAGSSLEPIFKEPPKFPMVTEDLCFEILIETQYSAVIEALNTVAKKHESDLVVKIYPIDIYQKKDDKKQVTNRLVLTPKNASLTDAQVKEFRKECVEVMKKLHGVLI